MTTFCDKFFLLVLLSISCHCFAQEQTHINYSISEGLPSAEAYDIFQDKKGFLWFATDNGVTRFDGKDMKNFNVKDGLADPVIFGFYEDYKGRIWFRSYSGKLSYFENGTIHPYKYNDKLSKLIEGYYSFSLHCDSTNRLWLISGAIITIDSVGNATKKRIPSMHSEHLKIENHDMIGGSGTKGSFKKLVIDGKVLTLNLSDSINGSLISRCVRWNNKLYLSFNNNIFEYDGNSATKAHTGPSTIVSIYLDRNNSIWIGYLNHGLKQFNDRSFSSPFELSLLSKKTVTKSFQDHEGGYWFSTLENGIYYFPNISIENFPLPVNSKINNINYYNNLLLIGDMSGDLSAFDPISKKVVWKKSFKHPIISTFVDRKKNIWLSTQYAFFLVDSTLTKTTKIAEQCFVDYSEGNKGNLWAIGSTQIFKFNSAGKTLNRTNTFVYHRSILIKDNHLYMPTRMALEVRDTALNVIPIPEGLKKFKTFKLITLNDTLSFAPTSGSGYLVINTKNLQFSEHNSTNNFIADNIYASTKTESDLWLATEKGIVKMAFNSSSTNHPNFNIISKRCGLPTEKFSFLIKSGDFLYGFSEKKYVSIPTKSSNFVYTSPKFYIKKLIVNDLPVDTTITSVFSYNQNNIGIAYGFIAFNNQNITVRYRLKPGSHWVNTNTRDLSFSSMASGVYNFQLEYSIDNIYWKRVMSLDFKINPPWWETWYFYTTITAMVLLFILWIADRRIKQFREKNQLLNIINEHQQKLIQSEIETTERERSRIAKELHDSVGTNLTAIKMYVGQLLKKHNEPVAAEVEDQLQSTIRELKDLIYGLTPSALSRYGLFEGLGDYCEKLNKTIEAKIVLNTFGTNLTNQELNINIFRIIQELISNSLKHASASEITIHLNAFDDLLNIIYEDNGVGFSNNNIRGLGLNNIESRLQAINGKLIFETGDFGVSYTIDIPISDNAK